MFLIYGKNKVGQAVAALCEYRGLTYELRDDSDAPHSYDAYEGIIPSPGVPGTHPIYATGKVIAELDFAYQFLPRGYRISAITGTDGKSTTSWILYSILQKEYFGKKSVYLSGNFDIPFSETVLDILRKGETRGEIVVEVSSFMSHWIGRSSLPPFSPDYSIFTNCKADHLNWHYDLQEYFDAKMNLIEHTNKRVILNKQVEQFAREQHLAIAIPENTRIFSHEKSLTPRDWTDGEKIVVSGRKKYSLSETHFSGLHNALNILACSLVTNEMKICSKRVRVYLGEIKGLPHRLEIFATKGGVICVDDSKSTSSQSLSAALGAFGDTKNLLLIVGGSDKGDSFTHLDSQFHDRVKAMVCIGETKEQFIQIAQKEQIPYLATDALSEGVKWLYQQASPGDVLMLSPGCASFGLFRDYLDRAEQFREVVKNLPE